MKLVCVRDFVLQQKWREEFENVVCVAAGNRLTQIAHASNGSNIVVRHNIYNVCVSVDAVAYSL